MALTDADRLQMTAIALMKYSVMTHTVAASGGVIMGVPTQYVVSLDGLIPNNIIIGTLSKIE